MTGDYSRWTGPNAKARHYAGVLMQQGRLHTDADWNESVILQSDRTETALGHIIGAAGTPKGAGGFAISPGVGGFRIGAGRYFIGGAMVENDEETSYDEQGDDIEVPELGDLFPGATNVVVYLEATRPHVTARDDSRLADPALGSVDTATRVKAAWRVGVEEVSLTPAQRDLLIETARCGHVPALPGWGEPTGRMVAGTVPAGSLPADSDCLIPPEAGYLSQENQLYRIQIMRGGTRAQARFAWSRENGSVEAVLARNADGEFILQGAIDDEALGFVSGGWVEVYDAADTYMSQSGALTRLTLTDGVASFNPGIGDFDQMVRPRVRRWDHGGASALGLQLRTTPTELERGIQVTFTDGTYREGDYWVFEARAAAGNIIWPPYPLDDPADPIPPMGWGRRRAPLALGRVSAGALGDITDLRAEFPTLTCLQAEDVGFDDTVCRMGAQTVQEALEVLCQRGSGGLCTFVVSSAAELVAAVNGLSARQSVRICLRGTSFALAERLLFDNLGHVVIEGTGPQTVVSVAETEPAMVFRNCASVRVVDLSVNGGPTGTQDVLRQSGRLGALTAIACRSVSYERVRARCRSGLERSTSCLSARDCAQVLVRDCALRVGQAQIGVQVIGASRSVIEHNVLFADRAQGDIVRRRVLADPVLVSRLRRSLLSFPHSGPSLGNVLVRDTDSIVAEVAPQPLAGLFTNKVSQGFPARRGDDQFTFAVDREIVRPLLRALQLNRSASFGTEVEVRRHLRNVMTEAIRSGNGRATIGTRTFRVLPGSLFEFADIAFMAQGIVIAGDAVEDTQVIGNRIERATEGIRVAASSRADRVPPVWSGQPPRNLVRRARINGNVITTLPFANAIESHGIFLGHVENVSVGENDISPALAPVINPDRITPHFGIYQYGYRGARLTMTENSVSGLFHGFVVIPGLDDSASGIWRLRDNAAAGCERRYVTATGVQVL